MHAEPEPTKGCGHDAAQLLPWFVAGRLELHETAEVQSHLERCVDCRDERQLHRSLFQALQSDDRVEHSPQPSLDKLLTRIDEFEREVPPASAIDPPTPPRRAAVSRWLVAALFVQTVGLAFLGSQLYSRSGSGEPPARYRTLSAPVAVARDARLRIVFAPGTTVGDASQLLHEVNAQIVAGPTEAGALALALDDQSPDAVAKALAGLRADARIVFAEPIEGAAHASR